MRVEKLKREYDVEIALVHFPLHPETPVEGRSVEEMYRGRNLDPDAMWRQMKARMDAEGLPYGKRTHTYNSRLAQELGKWADTHPGGWAIHDRIFRAYFVDGRNIGDPEVLLDIVRDLGRDEAEARRMLDSGDVGAALVVPRGFSAAAPAPRTIMRSPRSPGATERTGLRAEEGCH